MQILGVSLRRPTARHLMTTCLAFAITAAVLCAIVAGMHLPIYDPTTLVAMMTWGLFATAFGIDLRRGWRHWALFLSGFVVVVLVFTLAHAALTASL